MNIRKNKEYLSNKTINIGIAVLIAGVFGYKAGQFFTNKEIVQKETYADKGLLLEHKIKDNFYTYSYEQLQKTDRDDMIKELNDVLPIEFRNATPEKIKKQLFALELSYLQNNIRQDTKEDESTLLNSKLPNLEREKILYIMCSPGFQKIIQESHPQGANFIQLFTIAESVCHAFEQFKDQKEISEIEIIGVTEQIIRQREIFKQHEIMGPQTDMIIGGYDGNKLGTSFMPTIETYVARYRRSGGKNCNNINESCCPKESFLHALEMIPDHPTTIVLASHGSPESEYLWLNDSTLIGIQEIAKAISQNPNAKNVTWIIDGCYSYFFGQKLIEYIQYEGLYGLPRYVITSVNGGKVAYFHEVATNIAYTLYQDIKAREIRGSHILGTENEIIEKENLAILMPDTPDRQETYSCTPFIISDLIQRADKEIQNQSIPFKITQEDIDNLNQTAQQCFSQRKKVASHKGKYRIENSQLLTEKLMEIYQKIDLQPQTSPKLYEAYYGLQKIIFIIQRTGRIEERVYNMAPFIHHRIS